MLKAAMTKHARSLILGGIFAIGGFIALVGTAGAADADEFGIITNDPSPCTELLGACIGGLTEATYDARQDDSITLVGAVCQKSSIFDLACPGIGATSVSGVSSIEVQFDMEGDGIADYTDNDGGSGYSGSEINGCETFQVLLGGWYCDKSKTFDPMTFAPSPNDGWDMQTRICGLGGSPCSGWERWSLAGIETDYDIQCTPGTDNDGDGIPCEFEFPGGSVAIINDDDRDNDANFQRDGLSCITSDVLGLPGVDLEMGLFGDFSVATVSNFCKKNISFFGTPFLTYFGGLFAWADVTILEGELELAVANFWTTTGFVGYNQQGTVEAFLRGSGFCTAPSTGQWISTDFGICNFQVMMQDDTQFLTQDEFQIRVRGRGFFGTSFNKDYGFDAAGNRDAASSLASLGTDAFIITPE